MSHLRVIGGIAKGRKLKTVPGDGTRPILDRVKAPLFDILRPDLPGMVLLDMFAGTGSVGIEALSQGAEHCTFLDISEKCTKVITDNLRTTELEDSGDVRLTDAFRFLRGTDKSFNLIYVAPPQYENLWEEALRTIAERPGLLKEEGRVIVQIDPKEYSELELSDLVETRQKRYGNTLLVFYGKDPTT